MKKLALFAAALVLTFGLAQCKKEQTQTEGKTVQITVKVANSGSKANVDPSNGHITFNNGDKLYVGYNSACVGTLTYSGSAFSGSVSGAVVGTQPLHFYYLGGAAATVVDATHYSADISNQSSNYPVISYGTSTTDYTGSGSYETTLLNQCGLVKFNLATGTAASVSVGGLYTKATIDFANPGVVTPGTTGSITLHEGASNTERWAILLPQVDVTATATISGYTCSISSFPDVAINDYNTTGVDIAMTPAATSLSELKTAINGGTDCSSYIGWEVNSAGAIAASSVSGTKIGYVAYVSTSDVDAGVSGSRILVIANADAGTSILWGSYGISRGLTADDLNGYSNTNTLQGYGSEAHPAAYAAWNYSAAIPSGGASPAHWFMPTKKQWENMRDVYSGSNLDKRNAMISAYGMINVNYWTSTEYNNVRAYRFSTNGGLQYYVKNGTSGVTNVRAVFAY